MSDTPPMRLYPGASKPGTPAGEAAALSQSEEVPEVLGEMAPGSAELLADWTEGTYLLVQWCPFVNGRRGELRKARVDYSPGSEAGPLSALATGLQSLGRWPGGWGTLQVAVRERGTSSHVAQRTWTVYLAPLDDEEDAGGAFEDDDDDDDTLGENLARLAGMAMGAAAWWEANGAGLLARAQPHLAKLQAGWVAYQQQQQERAQGGSQPPPEARPGPAPEVYTWGSGGAPPLDPEPSADTRRATVEADDLRNRREARAEEPSPDAGGASVAGAGAPNRSDDQAEEPSPDDSGGWVLVDDDDGAE